MPTNEGGHPSTGTAPNTLSAARTHGLLAPHPGGVNRGRCPATSTNEAAVATIRHAIPITKRMGENGAAGLTSLSLVMGSSHSRRGFDAQQVQAVGQDPADEATQA